jgi:uncharacterized phage-associated protein
MRAYQKERFLNAVCFFAKEHSRRTGRPAFQTYIYKYLALFDFKILEEEGQPALDIAYKAMEMGPVPIDLYSKKEATSHYEFMKVNGTAEKDLYVIDPIRDPDLDYFSEAEIAVMNGILDEFAKPKTTTQTLIKATHERIAAWRKVWKHHGSRQSVPMSYEDNFNPRRHSESSERFKTYKALTNVARRRAPLERV